MNLSTVLDTVIGVIFLFLAFSLLVSGAGETIGRLLTLRQRHLWRALRRFVDGERPEWNRDQRPKPGTTSTKLTDRLSEHGLIRQLEGRIPTSRTRIGRIPSADFARALADELVPNPQAPTALDDLRTKLEGLPDGSGLKAKLLSVLKEADASVDRIKGEIGDWFDARMEWLSEVYKRHLKVLLVVVGFLIAWWFNVDAVRITSELYRDDALRAAVVEQAASLVETCSPTQEASMTEPPSGEDAAEDLDACLGDELKGVSGDLRLPVGWPDPGRDPWMRLLGWGISAAAVSQGAPFWYDVLRRATKIRKQ